MKSEDSGAVRVVDVDAEPIELSRLLKLAGATKVAVRQNRS
jgi:hypothetical protein